MPEMDNITAQMNPEDLAFSNEINDLMNRTWSEVKETIGDCSATIVGISFALDKALVDDIFKAYIPECEGEFDVVATVSVESYDETGRIVFDPNNSTLRAGVSYFFKGKTFEPIIAVPGSGIDPDAEFEDELPSTLNLMRVACKCKKHNPAIYVREDTLAVEQARESIFDRVVHDEILEGDDELPEDDDADCICE